MNITDKHIRNFLRVLAGGLMVIYFFDIAINKIKNSKIYLDVNDGYVILGCLGLLLTIEAVRAYVSRRFNANKKNNKLNKSSSDDEDESGGGAVTPDKGF